MKCKSCAELPATSSNNEASLSLCDSCSHLLENMALRPDMWQRLARIIGPNHYILHDDFYDDDGFPYAEEIDFDKEKYSKYRIKRGGDYDNVEAYLYDILTRYVLFDGDIVIPNNLESTDIINGLIAEIESTNIEEFRYGCYQILAELPKSDLIYTFLKKRWKLDRNEYWFAIASCVIKNFSISESSKLVEEALLTEEWQYPKDSLQVLSKYASEFAIDILSRVVRSRNIPVMYDLGATVRSCNPSWEKLREMILKGRPDSLMAIDALWIQDSPQYKRYFESKKLANIDINKNEIKTLLDGYLDSDSAPRVRSAIESVYERYELT